MNKKWIRGQELIDMGIAVFEIKRAVREGTLHPVDPSTGDPWQEEGIPPYLVPDDGFIGRVKFGGRISQNNSLEDALFRSDEVDIILNYNNKILHVELNNINTDVFHRKTIDEVTELLKNEGRSVEQIAYLLRENMPGRGRGGKASWAAIGRALRGHGHQDAKTYEDYAQGLYNDAKSKMT
jgi:hypothetical protein